MSKVKFIDDYKTNYLNSNKILFICPEQKWKFSVSDSIWNSIDKDFENKAYNLIYEWMLSHQKDYNFNDERHICHFYSSKVATDFDDNPYYININDLMKSYPKTFMERVDRVLINLSHKYPEYGEKISLSNTFESARIMFCDSLDVSFNPALFLSILEDLKYINKNNDGVNFSITASGWKYIDELIKHSNEKKQGFIAMKFGPETQEIRHTFKKAINDSGYTVRIIDEKEHNNQIVPEIFYEIKHSKFMVVDVTYPNYGAYYEAGYGQALGKEVIVCCREKEFTSDDKAKKPHFDIAQKSTIVWSDETDLYNKLMRRIEATIK